MGSSLVANIANGFGGRVARTTDTTSDALNWNDWGWSVPTAAGIAVNQASAMQVSAVYACVSYLSYDFAKLDPSIYMGQRHQGKRQKAKAHPLYPLFTKPARWLTWFEFAAMLQSSVLLRGNGYAVILRDARGRPTQLVPINPDRVALWEAPDGELFYMVTRAGLHQMAVLSREPLLIHSDDIFHLKALTMNSLLGLSPIALARESIGLAIAQEQLASRWAGNSAQPRGILTTDQRLTKEAAERMANDWKTLNSGLYNAGKTAVFEQGLTWKPLSMTSQDMEFIQARNFQLSEIARIFRVPPYMLGEMSASGRSSGGGGAVAQQAQEYLNYSLSTWIKMWETRIPFTFDVDLEEMFVEFDVKGFLRADIATRYSAHRTALGGTGWSTINEVRSQEGLEPVDGGDVVFRPVNTVPADSEEVGNPSGIGSDQTGEKGAGGGRPPDGLHLKDDTK